MTPIELFESHQKLAYFTLKRWYPAYLFDEDFNQVALMGLWRAAINFKPGNNAFSSFAVRCMFNELNVYWRRERKHLECAHLQYDALEDKLTDPVCYAEEAETLATIYSLCAQLPGDYAHLLQQLLSDTPITTIAQSRSVTERAVYEKRKHLRRKVKEVLA